MKKSFTLVLLLLSCQWCLLSQNRPLWIDLEYRNNHWPSEIWYVGFAQDNVSPNENIAKKTEAVKLEAMNQLSESIIVTISGQSSVKNLSGQISVNGLTQEAISSEFRQNLYSASKATIANQATETWHDKNAGVIYAFISVRRSELESFYTAQINFAIDKAVSLREIADEYGTLGRNISAKEKLTEAISVLSEADYYFTLLAAINASHPLLSKYQFAFDLRKQLEVSISAVERGPAIYLACEHRLSNSSDDAFDSDPRILEGIIRQALNEARFQLSDEIETADYVLTLVTSTSERSNNASGFGLTSYYANVDGLLINRRTGKELASFSIFRDPEFYSTGTTPTVSATKAFKIPALKDRIISIIIDSIPK